jgi:hypothetical protein
MYASVLALRARLALVYCDSTFWFYRFYMYVFAPVTEFGCLLLCYTPYSLLHTLYSMFSKCFQKICESWLPFQIPILHTCHVLCVFIFAVCSVPLSCTFFTVLLTEHLGSTFTRFFLYVLQSNSDSDSGFRFSNICNEKYNWIHLCDAPACLTPNLYCTCHVP